MANIDDIEVDFKVHDGYVAFSGEVVRLALLSPAVFAFVAALAGKDATTEMLRRIMEPGRTWLVAGLILMALAILFGLVHRYCAIAFMASLVEKRRDSGKMRGDWRTWASSISIFLAPLFLCGGAALLFVAVYRILSGG